MKIMQEFIRCARVRGGRALLSLWLGALACTAAHAQASSPAVLRKDLKQDFGARGDGKTNDQAAFAKAAAFFNQRAETPAGAGPAVLAIPKGVYLVGQQDAAGNTPDVLRLVNCRNLTIAGADSATTEVRYIAGLRYGAFDPKTQRPYEAPTAMFTDPNYAARGGTCVVLQGCDNIAVSGLNLNGNSPKLLIGGHWGDTGIQLPFDGIFVSDSRRVSLRRLALHHFGRDGIQVLNHLAKSLDDPQREGILLENSTCTYNGRQGLSLTGVNGFRAVNCNFSHTGRAVVAATGKALSSNPGAGIDLEPQDGFVANVSLENCRFVDNTGVGLVADRPDVKRPATTKTITVTGSLLWSTSTWSAWVSQTGFIFKNCRLYGSFVHGCQAATNAEATRFVGCTFEDRPYHGKPAFGSFTMHSDAYARRMSFTDCRFIGTHNYLIHAIPQLKDTASTFHFRNCSFALDYTQEPQGSYDKIMGSVFSGANVFIDGPHRTSNHQSAFLLGDGNAQVSTVLHAPGSMQFAARNMYSLLAGDFDIGRDPRRTRDSAIVTINANNAVVLNTAPGRQAELYIGPTSRFVVKKGGSLELLRYTKVTIAGQLVVENGAYFFHDPLAKVTVVGHGKLRVGPQVIKGKHPTLRSNYY
jgi:hypothetical protein